MRPLHGSFCIFFLLYMISCSTISFTFIYSLGCLNKVSFALDLFRCLKWFSFYLWLFGLHWAGGAWGLQIDSTLGGLASIFQVLRFWFLYRASYLGCRVFEV